MTNTETVGTALPPVTGFDDTGLPAWQEIRRLVDDEAPNLSQHVRDELAGMLVWARYGKHLASRTQSPAEPDQWRDLALQFDGHRIECLSMLRFAVRWIEEYATVRGILREPLASLKTFLAAPPLPGEAVLAARIEALRAASIPAPERSKEETGVRIKPLEWGSVASMAPQFRAGTVCGTYFVVRYGGQYKLQLSTGDATPEELGKFPSLETANHAAQADYEQRILSALETPPLHKEGEAVAYQWRLKERVMAHDATWSYVDYHTGLKIAEHPEKYETRPLYAAPVPVPVTITDEEVRNGARGIWDAGETGLPFEMAPPSLVRGLMNQSRACLTAALSQKPGEQG